MNKRELTDWLPTGIKKGGGDRTLYLPPKPIEPYGYAIAVKDTLIYRDKTWYAAARFHKNPGKVRYIPTNSFQVYDTLYPILGHTTRELSPIGSGPDMVFGLDNNTLGTSLSHIDRLPLIRQHPELDQVFTHLDYLDGYVRYQNSLIERKDMLIDLVQSQLKDVKKFAYDSENIPHLMKKILDINRAISRAKATAAVRMPIGGEEDGF